MCLFYWRRRSLAGDQPPTTQQRYEARRIAASMARLPELLKTPKSDTEDYDDKEQTSYSRTVDRPKVGRHGC
jgi:hypothetical protein